MYRVISLPNTCTEIVYEEGLVSSQGIQPFSVYIIKYMLVAQCFFFVYLPCMRQKLTRLCLQNRFACKTYAQLLEYLSVHFAQHNRAMNLTAT